MAATAGRARARAPGPPGGRLSPDGRRFAEFCRRYIRQSKGRWAGQPLELEPWQQAIVSELLRRRRNGQRRYREALIGMPRKNGKSTLAAALSLYLLLADDEPGPEVYAAAAARDQARIVFGEAREMVLASPRLLDWCQVLRDSIWVPSVKGRYRVLAADAPRQEGLNPHGVTIDELHAHPTRDLYDVLTTAQLAREEPLIVSITTAGVELEGSICGELYLAGKAGSRDDLYFHWLEVDDDHLDDEAAWKQANPASWITIEDLRREQARLPAFVFERRHLNRWTRADIRWLPAGAWDACRGDTDLARIDVAAVDLGVSHDTTAIAELARAGDKVHVGGRIFAVHPDATKPAPAAHVIVQADRLDLALVENDLRELARLHGMPDELAYDPWRFGRSAELLADEGFNAVEFPQSNERMVPASQGLFDAIISGRIVHDGDPHLRAQIEAAVARDTGRGWRLDKRKGRQPMDYAVALAIGLARLDAGDGGGFTPRFMEL